MKSIQNIIKEGAEIVNSHGYWSKELQDWASDLYKRGFKHETISNIHTILKRVGNENTFNNIINSDSD